MKLVKKRAAERGTARQVESKALVSHLTDAVEKVEALRLAVIQLLEATPHSMAMLASIEHLRTALVLPLQADLDAAQTAYERECDERSSARENIEEEFNDILGWTQALAYPHRTNPLTYCGERDTQALRAEDILIAIREALQECAP